MSLNCTTEDYDRIYEPWLTGGGDLLRLADYDPATDALVDLCGGTGAVSKAATILAVYQEVHNPDITLLDLNPRVTKDPMIIPVWGAAEYIDQIMSPESRTLVVCRQAMAYLKPEKVIPAVAAVLKPGGRFVFSTFKEPRRCRVKMYKFRSDHYLEFHLYLFGRVLHLQKRYGPYGGRDWSLFRYHPETMLRSLLHPHFLIEVQKQGRSLRWVCTKRGA